MHAWEGCVPGTPTHRDGAAEVAWERAELGGGDGATEHGSTEDGESHPRRGGGGGKAVVCQTHRAWARCVLPPLLLAFRH